MSSSHCAVCHKKNNQLLLLCCGHDPCIDCAAYNYFFGAQYRKDFKLLRQANYWCKICYEPTLIQKSTIQQLSNHYSKASHSSKGGSTFFSDTLIKSNSLQSRKFSKNQNKTELQQESRNPYDILPTQKSRNKPKKHNRKSNELENIIDLVKSQQFKSNKDNKYPKQSQLSDSRQSSSKCIKSTRLLSNTPKNLCPNHHDELQNYYCFTCVTSICVECALHGSHIGHEVQSVRKASSKLKSIYENIISETQKCKILIENSIKQIEKLIQSFKMWNSQQYSLVQQKFSQLFEMLAQKQKLILDQIKQVESNGIKQLNQQKKKQQKILFTLKSKRKSLKKSINEQPVYWNIHQIQQIKTELNTTCQSGVEPTRITELSKNLNYIETSLISQAIDTIEQLVTSFKVSYLKDLEHVKI